MTQASITEFMSSLDEHRDSIPEGAYLALGRSAAAVHAALPAEPAPRPFPPYDLLNISEEDTRNREFANALLDFLKQSYKEVDDEEEQEDPDIHHYTVSTILLQKRRDVILEIGYAPDKPASWDEDGIANPKYFVRLSAKVNPLQSCYTDACVFLFWGEVSASAGDAAFHFICKVYEAVKTFRERGVCDCGVEFKAPRKDVCFKCLFNRPAVVCSARGCTQKAMCDTSNDETGAIDANAAFCSSNCATKFIEQRKRRKSRWDQPHRRTCPLASAER